MSVIISKKCSSYNMINFCASYENFIEISKQYINQAYVGDKHVSVLHKDISLEEFFSDKKLKSAGLHVIYMITTIYIVEVSVITPLLVYSAYNKYDTYETLIFISKQNPVHITTAESNTDIDILEEIKDATSDLTDLVWPAEQVQYLDGIKQLILDGKVVLRITTEESLKNIYSGHFLNIADNNDYFYFDGKKNLVSDNNKVDVRNLCVRCIHSMNISHLDFMHFASIIKNYKSRLQPLVNAGAIIMKVTVDNYNLIVKENFLNQDLPSYILDEHFYNGSHKNIFKNTKEGQGQSIDLDLSHMRFIMAENEQLVDVDILFDEMLRVLSFSDCCEKLINNLIEHIPDYASIVIDIINKYLLDDRDTVTQIISTEKTKVTSQLLDKLLMFYQLLIFICNGKCKEQMPKIFTQLYENGFTKDDITNILQIVILQ